MPQKFRFSIKLFVFPPVILGVLLATLGAAKEGGLLKFHVKTPLASDLLTGSFEQGSEVTVDTHRVNPATGGFYLENTKTGKTSEISPEQLSAQLSQSADLEKFGQKFNCWNKSETGVPGGGPNPVTVPVSAPENSVANSGGHSALPKPDSISEISDGAKGLDLYDTAKARQAALQESAVSDQQTLNAYYKEMPLQSFGEHVDRAIRNLNESASTFSDLDTKQTEKAGLDASEQLRFRNFFMNARDKATAAKCLLEEDLQNQPNLISQNFIRNLVAGQLPNPLAKTKSLAEFFGTSVSKDAAGTQDQLLNRMIMFQGLPSTQQAKAQEDLKLIQFPKIATKAGLNKVIPLLHNGYIFGGGGSAIDCSSFVTQALPADLRKTRYTTLDFWSMYLYLKTGAIPYPPTYDKKRVTLIKDAADAFVPVDVSHGQKLTVGDLLVYRLPWDPAGHVFIVRSYNPVTLRAEVLEAAQSAGTVREREFPLSIDPMSAKTRYIRGGLLGLRLKPGNNKGCVYRDSPGMPQKHGGGK